MFAEHLNVQNGLVFRPVIRIEVAATMKEAKKKRDSTLAASPFKTTPRAVGRALKNLSESKCIKHA